MMPAMHCKGNGKKNAAMGRRLTAFSTFTTAVTAIDSCGQP
jgi:hypothetical protein